MILGSAAKQKAGSALERIGEMVERHAGAAMGVLLCLFFVALVGLAASNYHDYDELVIVRVASFPYWRDIWNFYANGLDTIGLLYALLIHGLLKLPMSTEISSRLPAMVGFLAMMWCTFVFVWRRYAAVYAFAMVLLLATFPLFQYSVYAKSYSLELAGVAFAMICWQSAIDGRGGPWSVLGIWLGLALAIYSHSFAIFLFVPFAVAQGLRDFLRKRVDWPVWLAIALFPAALLPVLHGDLLASKRYGTNFWSQPTPALLKQTYIDYFVENWRYVLILFVAALLVTALLKERRRQTESSPEERAKDSRPGARGFTKPEWVFVAMLAVLPIYVLPASYLLHAYRPDYVASFTIGFAMLLVALFAEHGERTQMAGVVLLLLFGWVTLRNDLKTIPQGVRALVHPSRVHAQLEASYDSAPWVKLVEASTLPVLVGDHHTYARLDCYAPPELRRRLYFLTDFADVDTYPQSNTSQRNFLSFGKRLSYQTMDIGDFLPGHSHFLLVVGTMQGTLWLPQYLLKQEQEGNASLQLLGPEFEAWNVYDVQFSRLPEFPKASPQLR
jgi:hypothetical protein